MPVSNLPQLSNPSARTYLTSLFSNASNDAAFTMMNLLLLARNWDRLINKISYNKEDSISKHESWRRSQVQSTKKTKQDTKPLGWLAKLLERLW